MGDFTIENLTLKEPLNDSWELMTIYVVRETNKIPWARITLIDGKFSGEGFQVSDNKFFEIGQKIKVNNSDYKNTEDPLFEGFIVKHSIKADVDQGGILFLELKDPVFKLTRHRKSIVYNDKKDSDIIKEIIDRYKDSVKFDDIGDTQVQHKQMVQYNCTDWDFILSRADVNGYYVFVKNGKISTKKQRDFMEEKIDQAQNVKTHEINYSEKTIYNFHIEMDGRNQYKSVSTVALDIENEDGPAFKKQENVCTELLKTKTKEKESKEEKDISEIIEKNIEGGEYTLINPVPIEDNEAEQWAKAKMYKDRLSFIEGRLKLDGKNVEDSEEDIWPGEIINLTKISTRFDGKRLVTGVRHQISESGWYVDVQFGTASSWFAENDNIKDLPASGLVPAIDGLHIGKVVKCASDNPMQNSWDGHFKVQVEIIDMFFQDNQDNKVWARLASPYASKDKGIFFNPELGDEVVLGFLNQDPRHPIILGSLYSSKRTPPAIWRGKEQQDHYSYTNRIMTSMGLLDFDNEEQILRIATLNEDNNREMETLLKMENGDHGGITMKDMHGNQIIMDENGITISSKGEINIQGDPVKINKSTIKK